MERTQIQFEPEQARALKGRAAERGVSVSALVREAVTGYLTSESSADRIERARAAGGAFASGSSDASDDHDRYLEEGSRE